MRIAFITVSTGSRTLNMIEFRPKYVTAPIFTTCCQRRIPGENSCRYGKVQCAVLALLACQRLSFRTLVDSHFCSLEVASASIERRTLHVEQCRRGASTDFLHAKVTGGSEWGMLFPSLLLRRDYAENYR